MIKIDRGFLLSKFKTKFNKDTYRKVRYARSTTFYTKNRNEEAFRWY